MKVFRNGAASAFLTFGIFALAQPAPALTEIPAYSVTEIGSQLIAANPATTYSVALAVNETGDAVGTAIVDGYPAPFIYTAEHGPVVLPRLGMQTDAVDLTDRDADGNILLVGTADAGYLGSDLSAVMWVYSTASGTLLVMREIGPLPGYGSAVATGVNNDWIVVGYSTNFDLSGTQAMSYDARLDLLAGFDFPAIPADINDFGEVVGGSWVGTLDGFITDLGTPHTPLETSQSSMKAINDLGWATGYAVTTISDGEGRKITATVRHTDFDGWKMITANSAMDTGNDINNSGDVVALTGRVTHRPVLYIGALDAWYYVNDLMAAGFTDRYVTRTEGINDAGQIAGSGTGGAVLLTPVGALFPPPPPADLTAVAHDSTSTEPWIAIVLGWTDTSDLETGFNVERSPTGTGAWTTIASGWTGQQFWDRSVEAGMTYEYRVSAVGIAGVSAYSNIATATAPSVVIDVIAPTIAILSPASGSEVSERLDVAFETSDDKGLGFVEVSIVADADKYVICGQLLAGETSFSSTCSLNLRKIPAGTYAVEAYARDSFGNDRTTQITVVVLASDKGRAGGNCNPKKVC